LENDFLCSCETESGESAKSDWRADAFIHIFKFSSRRNSSTYSTHAKYIFTVNIHVVQFILNGSIPLSSTLHSPQPAWCATLISNVIYSSSNSGYIAAFVWKEDGTLPLIIRHHISCHVCWMEKKMKWLSPRNDEMLFSNWTQNMYILINARCFFLCQE